MPSDPLPLSPTGRALGTSVEELLGVQFKSNEAYRGWLATADRLALAIEQEARTLARAEVIAELRAEMEATKGDPAFGPHSRNVVLAALSRLGERERP